MYYECINNILGIDHYQGPGKMEKISCSVRYIRITPSDLDNYPYIIWVGIGKHTHPPPAITKTPNDIRKQLYELITRIYEPALTRSKLIYL
jgi:hypothetical protein